ncbi:tyrosine-type recombinase/integrase [Sediminispirochaeta smaragdinae]|uniref:Integrase family protein n=1 Tax=Sediminispirochaeta smaragdinae (strain DSM 11293 / JCM 15392 / SEBR 4228) TaxID=573413 RepID=E1R1I8_SEDSS|nr:site-specific integrase [Sediminispirochaeta smaragdinae]ADK81129.1 integrase family protein [Sediminispirochaeta smaragdinae DSM 11293]
MARFRDNEYILFPRTLKNKTVWYYQAYGTDGKRLPAKSTGIGYTRKKDEVKSRKEAVAYCQELLEKNRLSKEKVVTLAQWVESRYFWDYRRSSYVRAILARSSKEKPGITENYCNGATQITRDHILPYHGDKPIEKITPLDCEDLLFKWANQVSHKTANNWKSVYSTILGEYERIQKMRDTTAAYFNPWRMVRPLSVDKNRYGALSIDEVEKLLEDSGISSDKDRIYYTAMKVAFMAGLRIGEVCGLFTDDVIDSEIVRGDKTVTLSYLQISKQYHSKLKKRTPVKDKGIREIPIMPELREELNCYMTGPERFVFSHHPRQETPLTANRLREWMYKRMDEMGIEREGRNITFHSARRFFNTLLRHNGVSDDVIRKFTGHDSQEMTDHYTDYLPEDLRQIAEAQKNFLTSKAGA